MSNHELLSTNNMVVKAGIFKEISVTLYNYPWHPPNHTRSLTFPSLNYGFPDTHRFDSKSSSC